MTQSMLHYAALDALCLVMITETLMSRPAVTEYGFNPKELGLVAPIKAVEVKESPEGKKSKKKQSKSE